MVSSELNNKKKESNLSHRTSQEMNNSKKEFGNENDIDNINYNDEVLNISNNKSPEKSISIIKNSSNNNIDLESFEKGINQIKLETQEEPSKKEENTNVEKKEEYVKIENKEEIINVSKKEENENVAKKEEKPIRKYKYNRFNKFGNNTNNENKEKNVIVEEKTTIVKNVYRTRRPVKLNNNEDKKEEKRDEGNENKKEEPIPKRYHRRYRDNKISTNIGK